MNPDGWLVLVELARLEQPNARPRGNRVCRRGLDRTAAVQHIGHAERCTSVRIVG
jgi:hypothetical protein